MEVDLDEVYGRNVRRVIRPIRERGHNPGLAPDGLLSKAALRLTRDETRAVISAEEWASWRSRNGDYDRKRRRSAANGATKGVPGRRERSQLRRAERSADKD